MAPKVFLVPWKRIGCCNPSVPWRSYCETLIMNCIETITTYSGNADIAECKKRSFLLLIHSPKCLFYDTELSNLHLQCIVVCRCAKNKSTSNSLLVHPPIPLCTYDLNYYRC